MAFVIFFALCCCIPIVAFAYSMVIRDGASEDDIRNLPKYRFCQDSSLMTLDNDKKLDILTAQLESSNNHIKELALNPEDSVSSVFLYSFVYSTFSFHQICLVFELMWWSFWLWCWVHKLFGIIDLFFSLHPWPTWLVKLDFPALTCCAQQLLIMYAIVMGVDNLVWCCLVLLLAVSHIYLYELIQIFFIWCLHKLFSIFYMLTKYIK